MTTCEERYTKSVIVGFLMGIALLSILLISHFNYYDLVFLVVVLYRFIKYLWIKN